MKTFRKFRTDAQQLNERFLTYDECRKAYYEGVKNGTIGKCPKCGSPNLDGTDEYRTCVDCGKKSNQWRIKLKEAASPGEHELNKPSHDLLVQHGFKPA